MTDPAPINETDLERLGRERDEKRAKAKAAWEAQRVLDLRALGDLEDEHGLSSVGFLNVPHTPGLPTLIACKVPEPKYFKRYKERVRPKGAKAEIGNISDALDELGAACRIYPDDDTFKALLDARPGVLTQLGSKAAELASAHEADDAKP